MQIVCFGDSLTWGGYGGSYVGEIRHQVGSRHHIINAGVGGNTVINLARRLESDVLAHQPDKVFIMVGGNDAVSYSQPDTRPYYRKAMQIPDGYVSPETFHSEYRRLLEQLQANHIETFIGLQPIEANPLVVKTMRQFNQHVREAARAYNIPILDLFAHFVPAHIPQRRSINHRFIVQIGERERTGWADWYTAQEEHGYSYTFDGVHWTPKAAQEAAALITAFMQL